MNGDSNLAVFCDFENIALGVRDAKLKKLDIRPIVERLLLKGSIVAKKAYCDWERYKEYKATMHEAAFELIEIPHTRISGKNSADIRMVVDALDLCYTKEHIDTFVVVSGDSDFSPLVSKLRENAKSVIGVGVKSSTSDLLVNNCDEFIFYDDLVAERKPARRRSRSKPRAKPDAQAESAPSENAPVEKNETKPEPAPQDDPTQKGLDLVVQTAEAIYAERGDGAKLWGSMIKQTLKRRRPGFNESAYGFGSFNDLLEEAQSRGLLELDRDERSGGYVIMNIGRE